MRAASESDRARPCCTVAPMRLVLHPLFDFSETLASRALLANGVGPGGRIASLVGEYLPGEPLPPDATFIRGGPSEPLTFATAAIFWDGAGTAVRELPLEKVRVRYPFVQPLPDGGLLVAGARVAAGEEPNAFVVDPTGKLTRRIMFGDGIEHIQVDLDGKAWVGYFDEGIFGNLGWGNPGGPESIGSTGLNRFDLSTGNIEWTFKPPPGAGSMADCYALNVADDEVWVYYYTDFDLIRIDRDGSMRRWATGWSGGRAIATDGTRAVLIGSYGDPTSASVRRFSEDGLIDPQPVVLELSDGRSTPGQVVARGDRLYAADGPLWFAGSIGDISDEPRSAGSPP